MAAWRPSQSLLGNERLVDGRVGEGGGRYARERGCFRTNRYRGGYWV